MNRRSPVKLIAGLCLCLGFAAGLYGQDDVVYTVTGTFAGSASGQDPLALAGTPFITTSFVGAATAAQTSQIPTTYPLASGDLQLVASGSPFSCASGANLAISYGTETKLSIASCSFTTGTGAAVTLNGVFAYSSPLEPPLPDIPLAGLTKTLDVTQSSLTYVVDEVSTTLGFATGGSIMFSCPNCPVVSVTPNVTLNSTTTVQVPVTTTGTALSYALTLTQSSGGSGGNWLSIGPPGFEPNTGFGLTGTGGTPIMLTANPQPGQVAPFNATVTVWTADSNSPSQQAITVTYVPSAAPMLQLSSSTGLTFSGSPNSPPPNSQTVQVTSSGSAISYTVSASTTSGGNWLLVSPSSGTTAGTETISIDSAVLAALGTGTYAGSVVFTCSPSSSCGNTNGQATLPVTLTVSTAPGPQLLYTAAGTFASSAGSGADPLGLAGTGFNISFSVDAIAAAQVSLIPATFPVVGSSLQLVANGVQQTVSCAAGASLGITYGAGTETTFNLGSCSFDTGSGTSVTLSGTFAFATTMQPTLPNIPLEALSKPLDPVNSSLTYAVNGANTQLTASSGTIAAACTSCPTITVPPTVTLTNTSTMQVPVNTTGALLSYAATLKDVAGGNWLTVGPAGIGTTGFGLTGTTAQGGVPITLTANPPAGQSPPYTATVTVYTADANTPFQQNISVTYVPSVMPMLQLSPSTGLTFSGSPNSPPPNSQTVQVTSSGGAISYTVSASTTSGGNWLLVSPSSAMTTGTETVSIDSAVLVTLPVGTYSGTVVFTCSPSSSCANANGQITLPVTLMVTAAPGPQLLYTASGTFASSAGSGTDPLGLAGTAFNISFSVDAIAAAQVSQIPATFPVVGSSLQFVANGVQQTVSCAAGANLAITYGAGTETTFNLASCTFDTESGTAVTLSGAFAFATTMQPTLPNMPLAALSKPLDTVNSSLMYAANGGNTVLSATSGTIASACTSCPTITVQPAVTLSNTSTMQVPVNTTGALLSYAATVKDVTGGNWLTVGPPGIGTTGFGLTGTMAQGGTPITLTAIPQPGQTPPFTATVTVYTADANTPFQQNFAVTYSPSVAPILQLSPSTGLTFTSGSGGQAVQVTSSGGAIPFTVAAATATGGNWLLISPSSGTTAATETVSLDSSVVGTLAAGTYSGTVVFSCSPSSSCGNANGQATLPVTLTVSTASGPQLLYTTTGTFASSAGSGTDPLGLAGTAFNISFSVDAINAAQVSQIASTFAVVGSSLQLTANGVQQTLSCAAGASLGITYGLETTFNLTSCSFDTGTGTAVTLGGVFAFSSTMQPTLPNMPLAALSKPLDTVNSSLTYTVNGGNTVLSASSGTIASTCTSCPTITVPPTVTLANTSTVQVPIITTGSPLSYAATLKDVTGGNWLTVGPTGVGTTGFGLTGTTAQGGVPITLTAVPQPGQTPPFTATVTVYTADANTPFQQNFAVTYPGASALPTLMISPSSGLTFANSSGSQTVQVTSSGTAIAYTVAASTATGGNWLLVAPSSGTTSGSETVSIDPGVLATLTTGTYSGAVVFTCSPATSCANANGQLTLPVTLSVTGTLTASPTSVTFNYQINSSVPSVQPIAVTSTGGLISYTATAATTSGGNWLEVAPGSATTPTGVTAYVNQLVLTGLAAGVYQGSITLIGGNTVVVPVSLTVGNAVNLTLSPNTLTLSYNEGNLVPVIEPVGVFSNHAGTTFTASASTNNGGSNWLSIPSSFGQGSTTPATIPVTVAPTGLQPNTYTGQITVSSPGATPPTATVSVSLTVIANTPPKGVVTSSVQTFSLVQGSTPVTGQASVSNAGGGTLNFTALAVPDTGNWLSLNGSGKGTATPSMPASLAFMVNPGGLNPGNYTGQILVTDTGSGNQLPPIVVRLSVNQTEQTMLLTQAGLSFTAVMSGAPAQAQSFAVLNQGQGSMGWTTQTRTIPSTLTWLQATAAGTSTPQSPQRVTISVDQTGLAPGQYYGSVTVSAQDAANSPQTVSVLLNVTEGGALDVTPSGLILTNNATQNLYLFNPAGGFANYTTSVFTQGGNNWLAVSPASGTVNQNPTMVVSANPAGIMAGAHYGTVKISSGGTVHTIAVVLIVTGANSAARPEGTNGGCTPNSLAAVFQTLEQSQNAAAGQSQTLQTQVTDSCGNPVTSANGASTQVTFSSQDPPVSLSDIGNGTWQGTWVPGQSGAVNAVISTQASGLTTTPVAGSSLLQVQVSQAVTNAPPQPAAVVNGASFDKSNQGVVAPGGYVTIFGTNLSDGTALANAAPFQPTLDNTQLMLGNLPLPLVYVSPKQVNALIPQKLNLNTSYSLVVQRDDTLSTAVPLTMTELQPAIFTVLNDGQGAILIYGPSVVAGPSGGPIPNERPVKPGEYLEIYCTGLGPVEASDGSGPLKDGTPAPGNGSPLYNVVATTTVTIGGVDAPVSFSGLAPGFVALYQVNVQVPNSVPAGDAVDVVLTVTSKDATASSPKGVTVAVQ